MAVVARVRRARRAARRSARRLAGLALLALAFGFGGWHPAATAPGLAPAELIAAPVASIAHVPATADPIELVAPIAQAPIIDAPAAHAPAAHASAAHASVTHAAVTYASAARTIATPPIVA